MPMVRLYAILAAFCAMLEGCGMNTRKGFIRDGFGLASILAAQTAPAILVRSMVAARNGIAAAKRGWVNPYVTDGLVAMWDGEWNAGGGVHDATATVWKDLVGSSDLTVTGTWAADCLNGYGTCITDVYKDACNAHSMTMEIVAEIPTITPTRLFYVNGGNSWYSADNIAYKWLRIHDGVNSTAGLLPGVGETFNSSIVLGVGGQRRLWINGIDKMSFSYTTQLAVSTDNFEVGGIGQLIKSFRIYSRALNAAEISANYTVDKQRFNLT